MAYFGEGHPPKTTICALFWRCVWTALKGGYIIGVIGFLLWSMVFAWEAWVILIGLVLAVFLVVWLFHSQPSQWVVRQLSKFCVKVDVE